MLIHGYVIPGSFSLQKTEPEVSRQTVSAPGERARHPLFSHFHAE